MNKHKIHTAKTETTYIWAESASALFFLLAELIADIENDPDRYHILEDLVIGDYEDALPRKMGDKWYPMAPAVAEMLGHGISYTI
jgi:hypothetical protein